MTKATKKRLQKLEKAYANKYLILCHQLTSTRATVSIVWRLMLQTEQTRIYLNLGRVRYYLMLY